MNSRELVNQILNKVFIKFFFLIGAKVPTNWVKRLVFQGLATLIQVSFVKRAKMPTPQVQMPNAAVKLEIYFQPNLVRIEMCFPLKPNYSPSRIWIWQNLLKIGWESTKKVILSHIHSLKDKFLGWEICLSLAYALENTILPVMNELNSN